MISDFSQLQTVTSAPVSTAVGQREIERATKEVEAAVILAHKFARNEATSYQRIMNACSRPAMASKAIYSFKRGGAKVEGPSIRLAEVIARAWGNLQFGVNEVERKGQSSLVMAYCWDLETNIRSVREFEVCHVRDLKDGQKKVLTSERDIYELIANQGARRLRNCILSVIPEDVIDDAVNAVNNTLTQAAQGGAVDMATRIRKMLEVFGDLGITREQIETRLNVKVEAASAKQIVDLSKIYISLKDGYSEPSDWFVMPDANKVIKETTEKAEREGDLEKAEELIKKAKEAGVPENTLETVTNKIKEDDPKTVKQGIDFLNTLIADTLAKAKK